MTTTLQMDTSSFDRLLDGLEADVGRALRPAAQAAAQVFYDEVKKNVSQIKTVTGNLSRAIYQAHMPESSIEGQRESYRISWNWRKAPHGGLVEGGHMQRYKYYQNAQGQVRPMVRPGMDGRKKPAKRASQAVKDAYYVPLEGGPRQIPGKFFLRRAFDKSAVAQGAAIAKLAGVLSGGANTIYGADE